MDQFSRAALHRRGRAADGVGQIKVLDRIAGKAPLPRAIQRRRVPFEQRRDDVERRVRREPQRRHRAPEQPQRKDGIEVAPVKQPVVLEPTALPHVDASSDEEADYDADDAEASGKDTAVLQELQAWKAHKNAVLERERKRRRELRAAEAQEQAIGMS